jgi:thiamine-monophosphate kinase
MKVSKIGEFGLINVLSGMLAENRQPRKRAWRELLVDIGDDAMVWKPSLPHQIATVDSLVENIHFTLKTVTWRELGWKSLAVNLSDIAAMGGIPLYALISLGLPGNTAVADIKTLYGGMLEIGGTYNVAISGGDTVSSPFVFISVTVIGCASNPEGKVMRRSAALPGDLVAVTGALGASAGGLRMLLHNLEFPPKATAALRRAHLTPAPHIREGQTLVALGVKAGMDISDGLVGDLTHICELSRVGARLNVERVPVSKTVKSCFQEEALTLALSGGEDYELLFTAPPDIIDKVKTALKCPVTVVGEMTAQNQGRVILVNNQGKPVRLEKTGWDHFPAAETK